MTVSNNKQPILVVEDSDDDFEATQRAFKRAGNLINPLVRCEDGQEALDYLQKAWDEIHLKPGIVLLDLNLPGVDGREVLKELKDNVRLRSIPVVILTTSDSSRDIDECYQLGANTFIQKPVKLNNFFEAINKLKEYWFEIAILPKEENK